MASFYEFRMLNLLSKYDIPQQVQLLLKAHEDYQTGKIPEAELGRQMRLSPSNRSAVTDTMVKCAEIMGKTPEEVKHCLAIIQACAAILSIGNRAPPKVGFPSFLCLPKEVRQLVMKEYLLRYNYSLDTAHLDKPWDRVQAFLNRKKMGDCSCAPHERPKFKPQSLSLAFTSKQMSEEVLQVFFQNHTFALSCACEMGIMIRTNELFRRYATDVWFHWCGENAHTGISELGNMTGLKRLMIAISKVTTNHLSARQQEVNAVFGQHGITTMPQANGFEELTAIRGLEAVLVVHASTKRGSQRPTGDTWSLTQWLDGKLEQPRNASQD